MITHCFIYILFAGRRVTMATQLPQFSFRVRNCLGEQQPKLVWSLIVAEAAAYYMEHFPDISSRQEYSVIGRKMVAEYPCIKQDGNDDWVCQI